MSRRVAAVKRIILPDAKYNSVLVGKFINFVMRGGKKSVAESIVYFAMKKLGDVLREDPVIIMQQIVSNVRPSVEVCSRRFGGATYQVPREVSDTRSLSLAMKWIVREADKRKDLSMKDKLFEEMCDAYNNRGFAIKVRDDLYKLAATNRAFSHFRW